MLPRATLTPKTGTEPWSLSVVEEIQRGKSRASPADHVMRVMAEPVRGSTRGAALVIGLRYCGEEHGAAVRGVSVGRVAGIWAEDLFKEEDIAGLQCVLVADESGLGSPRREAAIRVAPRVRS